MGMGSLEFDTFGVMQMHIIQCGYLRVAASEMIQPIPAGGIGQIFPLDPTGRMKLAMNALLLVEGERLVLFDPGCADFLPSRLVREYGLEIPEQIEVRLARLGFDAGQVTDVIFTHLHFDHGSGAFNRLPGRIVKRFPRARYHVLESHFNYAKRPDKKESDSFFTALFRYVDKIHWLEEWEFDWIRFRVFNGHTRGMVVPVISTPEGEVYYMTDLVPMELFLDEGISSGYDLDAGLSLHEKRNFLLEVTSPSRIIFFHDPLKESIIYP